MVLKTTNKSQITFFPVGNGDMTLIELNSGKKILIDVNIRSKADKEGDDTPDVAKMLKERLPCNTQGLRYVDVFLLSHPDLDHCRGLDNHFHLGEPDKCPEDKILIGEIWSSPMVFRRASQRLTLSSDAKLFNTEAKRRVKLFKNTKKIGKSGDRILILSEDEGGKTDDLTPILVKIDELIKHVNGEPDTSVHARLLGPIPPSELEEEEALSKNNSSVIIHFLIESEGNDEACAFLSGGDAEVVIWEKLWEKYGTHPAWLTYDILQTPHHCSWHSLSHESWSETDGKAEISESARLALSQTQDGAFIVASSNPIEDNDNDPPCIGAKHQYEKITKDVNGRFICTGDSKNALTLSLCADGPVLQEKLPAKPKTAFKIAIGHQPIAHG